MSKKYIRFTKTGKEDLHYGYIENDQVTSLADAPWGTANETGEKFKLNEIKLKAPVEPSKIVCIGLNYHAHVKASYSADEAPEYPLIFLKPSSSIIGPEEEIDHPEVSERVDYEAELGVIISKKAQNVREGDADQWDALGDGFAAYTFGLGDFGVGPLFEVVGDHRAAKLLRQGRHGLVHQGVDIVPGSLGMLRSGVLVGGFALFAA